MAKILIADDDLELLSLLEESLEKEGHVIYTAKDGMEAKQISLKQPDLILLDVMMPEINGFQVCREIRSRVDCPILFITAKSDTEDLVKGLGLGGDDYIVKPFRIAELRARVYAHLRRENREKTHKIVSENISLDLSGRIIYVDEKELSLTPSEYKIAELLITNSKQVFSKEQIYEKIWGYEGEGFTNTVTEHIRNLRRKLKSAGAEKSIETVWGIGYKW
ncbi:response regulator transcription factor [Clostridium niameyense]|uniref:Stage 0 sporulation protein A homolog n=1 Tax=Clostridium niameyense TaxID=1622073 RepID=A0A6M0R8G9_9CLOT|nr:response regulator transcription factor [Clostridium niameyense]NEZ46543.1 response regulator transcription factor [Clostridium niameyense]